MTNAEYIAQKFNITLNLAHEITVAAIANTMDDLDTEMFEGVLIAHYVENNQLPYEVMTTGDPFEWVAQTIRKELGIE